MKLSQKFIITFSSLLAAVLCLSFCFYTVIMAESTYPESVDICGIDLPDGSYLANDSDEPTTDKPKKDGYVYYKDGVITLNNAKLCTKDDDFADRAAIWTPSDITITLIGDNQIGKAVDSPSILHDNHLFIGILAADSIYSSKHYNISINGSGNLTIYDLSKGIWGQNISIDMTGNLNVIEYGSDNGNIPECCLKADGGSLCIKNGNLDLRSYLSCCMYADTGIYITGGNVATCNGSMGGNLALNCEPEFDVDQYKVEVSNEIDVSASVELDAWNGTDNLTSFHRVNFTDLTSDNNTPSGTPTATPTVSPTVTPTATPAITNSKSISVKKVAWKSLKNKKKKKAVASWKKVSKTDGYQLQYATNKKFKAKKSILTKKTKYTIKKLKKKTYYVRVRAYKFDGQKKVYGKWSKIKKVKIKK